MVDAILPACDADLALFVVWQFHCLKMQLQGAQTMESRGYLHGFLK